MQPWLYLGFVFLLLVCFGLRGIRLKQHQGHSWKEKEFINRQLTAKGEKEHVDGKKSWLPHTFLSRRGHRWGQSLPWLVCQTLSCLKLSLTRCSSRWSSTQPRSRSKQLALSDSWTSWGRWERQSQDQSQGQGLGWWKTHAGRKGSGRLGHPFYQQLLSPCSGPGTVLLREVLMNQSQSGLQVKWGNVQGRTVPSVL